MLVTVIMGDYCKQFLKMSFGSVKESDKIVFVWGKGDNDTFNEMNSLVLEYPDKVVLLQNEYSQNDAGMNGKQRNFYLNYLKQNYSNDWALCIDADEVVENIKSIKEFIRSADDGIYDVRMRHFHQDLGHEDSTVKKHYVLGRLFKINSADNYPEVEHPVINGKRIGNTDCSTIWHLAHINHCFSIKKRFEKNLKHSNVHPKEYLEDWRDAHILGIFPNSEVGVLEIPDVITDYFGIDKDKYYFQKRLLEVKHFIMTRQWIDFFKPESVLEVGCGLGSYVFCFNMFGIKCQGFDISKYAVEHSFVPTQVWQDSLENTKIENSNYDLVIAFDVLEHIEELDKAVENLRKITSKHLLVSVPVIGDPNLDNDKTHKVFLEKQEWINLIESKGFKLLETPNSWLFNSQIMIFEVKND